MGPAPSRTSAVSREDLEEYLIVERLVETEDEREQDGNSATHSRFDWNHLPPEQMDKLRKGFLKLEYAATHDQNGKVIYDHDMHTGDAEAMWRYAIMLAAGRGCEQDEARAVEVLKWAHRRQHVEAAYALADMYFMDRGMEVVQPYFNQFRAVVLWQWCADRGHVPSHIKLAHAYRTGIGVKRADKAKAAEHFAKATSQSVADAANQIADMYENGTGGVKKDESKAAARYQTATNNGDADAMYKLGTMYMEGRGVEKSFTKARGMFDQSVEQGNADAQYHMAILLCKTDPFKAIGLINHAAQQGHARAQMQKERLKKGLQIEDDELVPGSSYQKTVSKVKRATMNAVLKKKNLLAAMEKTREVSAAAAPTALPKSTASVESPRRPVPAGLKISEEPSTLPPVAVASKDARPPTTPMTPTFAAMKRMTEGLKNLLSPGSSSIKKGFDKSPSDTDGAQRFKSVKGGIPMDEDIELDSQKLPAIKGAAPKEPPLSPLQRLGKVFSRKS